MSRDWVPCVYLLASRRNGTFYIGVTSDLIGRLYEHREGITDGFTSKYDVRRLVWFEVHGSIEEAILREKRIKKWNRAWKQRLVEEANPAWRDLAIELGFGPLPSLRMS